MFMIKTLNSGTTMTLNSVLAYVDDHDPDGRVQHLRLILHEGEGGDALSQKKIMSAKKVIIYSYLFSNTHDTRSPEKIGKIRIITY